MISSPTTGRWAEAMSTAQAAMRPAKRNASNPNFNSRYADQYSVAKAVQKPLSANGLAIAQGEKMVEGRLVVATRITHRESGEWQETHYALILPKACSAHDYAAAFTYAARIGLAKACGLAIDEDDDGNRASGRAGGGDRAGQQQQQRAETGRSQQDGQAVAAANEIMKRARGIENAPDLRDYMNSLSGLNEEHPAIKGVRRFLEQRLRTLEKRALAA